MPEIGSAQTRQTLKSALKQTEKSKRILRKTDYKKRNMHWQRRAATNNSFIAGKRQEDAEHCKTVKETRLESETSNRTFLNLRGKSNWHLQVYHTKNTISVFKRQRKRVVNL